MVSKILVDKKRIISFCEKNNYIPWQEGQYLFKVRLLFYTK